jgi:(p)ppGpp synthase/HD superfamily hydrolase
MRDYDLALGIAERFHAGQKYGEHPYTTHLLAVADSVSSQPDERLQVIAILHDVLEDTSCTKEILFGLFEDNIVNAVIALSKVDGEEYEDYITRVRKNALATTVKIHDTLCNLKESVARNDKKRITKYSNQLILLVA